jgi:hypothetical protein
VILGEKIEIIKEFLRLFSTSYKSSEICALTGKKPGRI